MNDSPTLLRKHTRRLLQLLRQLDWEQQVDPLELLDQLERCTSTVKEIHQGPRPSLSVYDSNHPLESNSSRSD